jgi:hypothetical protein
MAVESDINIAAIRLKNLETTCAHGLIKSGVCIETRLFPAVSCRTLSPGE